MAITLPDARHLSDEVIAALRLRALRGCEMGLRQRTVADLLGLARETVSRWWAAYADAGPHTLPGKRTGRPEGSGRVLDDEQAEHICELLDKHSPQDCGIAAPLWSRRAVGELIFTEYGIRLPVRTVGEYLKRWGYTAKRPRRHNKKQDPEEVRRWLEETYPAIEEQARQEGAQVHFCDETGVEADQHPQRGYARKGQPAIIDVPDPHIRTNVISTVSNDGEAHFMSYSQAMTASLFIDFLERLLRETDRKVFLITDRLRAHQAALVEDWLSARQDRIELFFLPRRCPELNADEYLNNDLKGSVHATGLPNNKGELVSSVLAFLYRLLDWPDHVRRYFLHPCVQYAAESSL